MSWMGCFVFAVLFSCCFEEGCEFGCGCGQQVGLVWLLLAFQNACLRQHSLPAATHMRRPYTCSSCFTLSNLAPLARLDAPILLYLEHRSSQEQNTTHAWTLLLIVGGLAVSHSAPSDFSLPAVHCTILQGTIKLVYIFPATCFLRTSRERFRTYTPSISSIEGHFTYCISLYSSVEITKVSYSVLPS